jgi:hypothetical protein
MDGILLAIIAILWLVAIFVNNTRYGRARNLRGFSRHVPLPLTDAVATAIPRRLLRESVGAALGCVPALLVAFAMTIWSPELLNGASGSTIFPVMIAGAALGIAIASATKLGITNPDSPRMARTTVPRVTDYLSPVWIVTSTVVCLAGIVLVALLLPRAAAPTPLVATAIAMLATSVLTLMLCTALSRHLLAASQPATECIELAWDDAMRAHALRGLWVAPAITGLTTAYVASGLNATGTPSVDFFPFLLAITVLQAILQLSRPGARYRRRLWPALVTQI